MCIEIYWTLWVCVSISSMSRFYRRQRIHHFHIANCKLDVHLKCESSAWWEHPNRTFRCVQTNTIAHAHKHTQLYSKQFWVTLIHISYTHTHIFLCLSFPIVVHRFPNFTPLNFTQRQAVLTDTFVHKHFSPCSECCCCCCCCVRMFFIFVWRNECAPRMCVSPTMNVSLVFSVCLSVYRSSDSLSPCECVCFFLSSLPIFVLSTLFLIRMSKNRGA